MSDINVQYATFVTASSKIPAYYQDMNDGTYTLFGIADELFVTSFVTNPIDVSDFETNYKSIFTSVNAPDDARLYGTIANQISLNAQKTKALAFAGGLTVVSRFWSAWKTLINTKGGSIQYNDDGTVYTVYFYDVPEVYASTIWKGSVPSDIVSGGYSQAQNDSDKADFENNYKGNADQPINRFQPGDNRWIFRLGNALTTGSQELLVAGNGYFEQSSQAQRSVKSTSASDANPAGSGAKAVRITYLDSNYVQHVEDVNLNGTNAVATVNNNIRFIERFQVIKGTAAVGRIFLCTGSTGLGEICSIGAGATDAFLCHHYIPSGSLCEVIEWDVTSSDDTMMRLKGQAWFSGNLVDPIYYDLENIQGLASGTTFNFTRKFMSTPAQEKTKVYVTTQAQQATQTTVRARLNLWQDYLYVSGTT